MTARKADLGIDGVFASTSLSAGEQWRWQTHLANLPLFYEFKDDKNFDNKLWYGVTTTKIFCRPSCVSRLPKRENVSIFQAAEQALEEGYRPCKRCRPMDKIVPNEVWVEEIDLLLKNHYDEDLSLEELGQRLHGSSSYLRHIYKKIKGLTPRQELTRIRLEQARMRLLEGNEAISEIARAVGMMNTCSQSIP